MSSPVYLRLSLLLLLAPSGFAVRPFITDDARVVGDRLGQLEAWTRVDRKSFQHWSLVAVGPVPPLELTIGMVQGATSGKRYTVSGPLVQAKYLLVKMKPNRWPGLAVSGGAAAPAGLGALKLKGWDSFAYAALTESLFREDRVLVHFNTGMVRNHEGHKRATWGLGSQIQVRGGLHAVAEVFSGDPYAESSGNAVQGGFRHIVNDRVQVDATVGVGVSGTSRLPAWGSVGIRLVTNRLWGKK
jgi:hypothetical protein